MNIGIPQKQISAKGLADFMTAGATRQRTIVRNHKYPKDDDSRAKILYYREARDRITAHHRARHHPRWLLTEATSLHHVAETSVGQTATRLRHNARALRSYAEHFGLEEYDVLGELQMNLELGGVRVTANPDLHISTLGNECLMKFEFSAQEPTDEEIRIIAQVFFDAADQSGLGISAANIRFIDVPRGNIHRPARARARLRKDIESSCETISAIWETI